MLEVWAHSTNTRYIRTQTFTHTHTAPTQTETHTHFTWWESRGNFCEFVHIYYLCSYEMVSLFGCNQIDGRLCGTWRRFKFEWTQQRTSISLDPHEAMRPEVLRRKKPRRNFQYFKMFCINYLCWKRNQCYVWASWEERTVRIGKHKF